MERELLRSLNCGSTLFISTKVNEYLLSVCLKYETSLQARQVLLNEMYMALDPG